MSLVLASACHVWKSASYITHLSNEVSVDLIVTFDITDARNFSYHLGPANLDSLLRAP